MAGRVPDHIIQQIGRAVDFVRLVSRHSDLKKKGKSYWGLCPFHEEKTPSFSVDPENGLYYCFGCKEGGNAFTFLQKVEGLSFVEALRKLAAEAGVDLSRYEGAAGPAPGELSRLREVNELATSFYQKCLEKGRGSAKARRYLEGRSISPESLDTWRIGYAPEGWDNFLKCAAGRGYEPELVARAGLALERQGAPGHYDRFRNRLIFPIGDGAGRTIGFGARALDEGDEPKYLNSPETALFSKGNCFFGLAQAREAVRTGKTAVVLEGYTDVIMAHQCGVPEALAVLGTALTEHHARALGRLCERVVLVFDADEAGEKSAARSIEVLLNEEVEIRVAELPPGQDPCDYLLAEGGDAFRQRLAESRDFFQFRLEMARRARDTETLPGRMAAFRDVAELALLVRDPARRDMVVRWLAHELGLSESAAWAHVQQQSRRPFGSSPQGRRTAGQERAPAGQPGAADKAAASELLGLLLLNPQAARDAAGRLDVGLLPAGPERTVLATLLDREGEWDARGFLASLGDAELARAASRAMAEEQRRAEAIKETSVGERLETYVLYLQRKELKAQQTPVPTDDDGLREYARRLREQDRKLARPD